MIGDDDPDDKEVLMAGDRDRRPPKTPEEPTPSTRRTTNRDFLVRKETPARGIPKVEQDWTEDTGSVSVRKPDEDTPIGLAVEKATAMVHEADAEERLRGRVKETRAAVETIKSTTNNTNVGVATLRMEMNNQIERIDDQFVTLNGKVDDVVGHVMDVKSDVGDIKGDVGTLKGAFGEVVKALDNERERRQATFVSHTEIDTVAKVTEIKDQADVKKKRRELRYALLKKVGVWALGVLLLLATAYITHRIENR